jgi:hypothetical protein
VKRAAIVVYALLAALAWRWDHLLQLIPLTLVLVAWMMAFWNDRDSWQARDEQVIDAFYAVIVFAMAAGAELAVLFL